MQPCQGKGWKIDFDEKGISKSREMAKWTPTRCSKFNVDEASKRDTETSRNCFECYTMKKAPS